MRRTPQFAAGRLRQISVNITSRRESFQKVRPDICSLFKQIVEFRKQNLDWRPL